MRITCQLLLLISHLTVEASKPFPIYCAQGTEYNKDTRECDPCKDNYYQKSDYYVREDGATIEDDMCKPWSICEKVHNQVLFREGTTTTNRICACDDISVTADPSKCFENSDKTLQERACRCQVCSVKTCKKKRENPVNDLDYYCSSECGSESVERNTTTQLMVLVTSENTSSRSSVPNNSPYIPGGMIIAITIGISSTIVLTIASVAFISRRKYGRCSKNQSTSASVERRESLSENRPLNAKGTGTFNRIRELEEKQKIRLISDLTAPTVYDIINICEADEIMSKREADYIKSSTDSTYEMSERLIQCLETKDERLEDAMSEMRKKLIDNGQKHLADILSEQCLNFKKETVV